MSRKYTYTLMVLLLGLLLVACGGNGNSANDATNTVSEANNTADNGAETPAEDDVATADC
ncbi:MAG: hypothetical protein IPL78_28070, partial [Chloroflexi bacterium]|nr:hypothetical protein [Chloroflexota bacterium]